MPTPNTAFAAVAAVLAGVDPADDEAVTMFYRRQFLDYPLPVRALISDFLMVMTEAPTHEALELLRHTVTLPLSDIPEIEAPKWDERYGQAMHYASAPDAKVMAGS